jgi:hypothetical protein
VDSDSILAYRAEAATYCARIVLPHPLALLSAFCAAGRPAQNGCCVAGRENLVADDELRAEKEREQSQAGAKGGD